MRQAGLRCALSAKAHEGRLIVMDTLAGLVADTVNLGAMEGRLARLLSDFAWDRMDRAFAHVLRDDVAQAA